MVPSARRADLVRRGRVFVADAAEQPRHQVFQGHDAGRPAELVEHHRHRLTRGLHARQHLDHRRALGHDQRRPHQSAEVGSPSVDAGAAARGHAQQVLGGQDADHVVDGLFVHREAAVAMAQRDPHRVLDRRSTGRATISVRGTMTSPAVWSLNANAR